MSRPHQKEYAGRSRSITHWVQSKQPLKELASRTGNFALALQSLFDGNGRLNVIQFFERFNQLRSEHAKPRHVTRVSCVLRAAAPTAVNTHLSAVSDVAEEVAVTCDAGERSHGVEPCAGTIGGCFGEFGSALGCGLNSFNTARPAVT